VTFPQVVTGEAGRYERWDPARHTDAFVELCADPQVMRFLGGPMTPRSAAEVSMRIADHWDVFGFGLWAAIDPLDGRVAGFTGACKAAWHPQYAQEVEVGWRLARWSWGRGFATDGARLSLLPVFEHLRIADLLAFVHPDNVRSRAVVERLGMRRTGETVDPRLRHPLDIFELRRDEVRLTEAAAAGVDGLAPHADASPADAADGEPRGWSLRAAARRGAERVRRGAS
jgi:RimJ/RimL family protein N-acetyltransferase